MCLACAASGLSASWATYEHELTWLSGSGLIQQASGKQDPSAPVPLAASGTSTSPTGTTTTDAVISGFMWTGVVSYSFTDSASDYEAYVSEATNNYASVSFDQMQAIRYALEGVSASSGGPRMALTSVEGFTNLSIVDAGFDGADVRIGQSASANPTSYAYLPGYGAAAGDVWFGTNYNYRSPLVGNYAFMTAIHELGHALGLKHTFDAGGGTLATMPADKDSIEYSVMSYKSYAGQTTSGYTNETFGYAQTYMIYDIAALQAMYGADFTTRSTDTVYTWSATTGETFVDGIGQGAPGNGAGGAANRIFLTLWDGGGTDTYDLSNYTTAVTLDLAPGASSVLSATQLANLGNGHYAHGNVYNALQYQGDLRSLIENAKGGSGNDSLAGNQVANLLDGNGGNDSLWGLDGTDVLVGGAGDDQLFGGNGADSLQGGDGADTLNGGAGSDQMAGGAGGDLYIVDHGGDQVSELANEGTDTVQTSLLVYALGAHLENLLFTGSGNATLSGNALANLITGGAGNDTLTGDGGDDTLQGGGGNDRLDGGTGADLMHGGAGDDTYVVDHLGDTPLELPGDGTDTILTALSAWTLGSDLENLLYTGSGALSGTGNALDNWIVAGFGNDTLAGQGGNDTLDGGSGHDQIDGGAGNDLLTGGSGSDQLSGGDGIDTAYYDAARSVFTIVREADGSYSITDTRTRGLDRDVLTGIEYLQFSDALVSAAEFGGEFAPVASPVALFGGTADQSVTITEAQLLGSVIDLNGDTLTISSLVLSAGHGTLVDNGDRTWTFTPSAGAGTQATFAYTVSDGAQSAVSTATLSFSGAPSTDTSGVAASDDIFRFYSTKTKTHFYTNSESERDYIISHFEGFRYEGNAFDTTATADTGVGVYRFYNTKTKTHFYTSNADERDFIQQHYASYKYEGVAYYAYADSDSGAHVPLYRFYNTATNTHFFTADAQEQQYIAEHYSQFKYEGVAFYVDFA